MDVILADDEDPARERMATLLSRFEDVQIIAQASDGEQALALIEQLKPDAAFLDIRMPGLSGLDVADMLRRINSQVHVVFVSAFDEHAVEAFSLRAADYLTKPVRPSRLADTLDRIRSQIQPASPAALQPADKIGVPVGDRTELLDPEQIVYATVVSGLVDLICSHRRYHLTWTLKQLEDKLAGDTRFQKISRQTIVNLSHVKSIDPSPSGTGKLTLRDGNQLEASRSATRQLKARFK